METWKWISAFRQDSLRFREFSQSALSPSATKVGAMTDFKHVEEVIEELHECKRGLSVGNPRAYNDWWRTMQALLDVAKAAKYFREHSIALDNALAKLQEQSDD